MFWCTERQTALLREVHEALDAPLDERFRMLHPWLEKKADDACWGPRGVWQAAPEE
jgi:hypothetical protein